MLDTRPSQHDHEATASPLPGRRRWPDRLALGVPGVIMLVLGLWGLGRDGAMGNDEVATRWVSSLSLSAMRHVLGRVDAVHGLYYLIIHFWSTFGDSPTAIRVPSLIAMVAAVVVTAALSRRLTGSTRAGVATGLIAATCTSISFYAQTARSYAMVYLVVALATLVLVHALERERRAGTGFVAARPWLLYAALVVLAGYLNELSLLVLAAHLITVLCTRPRREAAARWLVASVAAVMLVAPLIVISRRQSTVLDYLRPPTGADVWSLFHIVFGGSSAVAIAVAVLAAAGVIARFPACTDRTDTGPQSQGVLSPATVGLPLLIVPCALLMLYSEVKQPLYADRYVLYCEIGAAVLAGAGLDRLAQLLPMSGRALRPAVTSVVLVACVAVLLGQLGSQQHARTPLSRQFDFGGPAQFVGAHARPGDGVLFFGLFYRKTRLGYPADFRDTTDFAQQLSPEQAASFQGVNKPFAQIRPLMLEHDRIWVVGRLPGQVGDTAPGIQMQSHVLRTYFVRIERRTLGRTSASLWRRA